MYGGLIILIVCLPILRLLRRSYIEYRDGEVYLLYEGSTNKHFLNYCNECPKLLGDGTGVICFECLINSKCESWYKKDFQLCRKHALQHEHSNSMYVREEQGTLVKMYKLSQWNLLIDIVKSLFSLDMVIETWKSIK